MRTCSSSTTILKQYSIGSPSNLKGAEYDTTTKKLNVTFGNGMKYEYDDVSHETFAELNLSESQGKYFNQKIAKNFTYRKT